MRLYAVSHKISFARNLTKNELNEYSDVLNQAKNLAGQTDKSVFIMPSSCLPQTKEFNSGIGHLSSDISQNYLEYMKNYLGFNIVEDLPPGQVQPNQGFYCAYNSSALGLGNHQINPELLTTKDFEYILSETDLYEISQNNTSATKDTISNFNNVMNNNGSQNTVLKKAYNNFLNLPDTSPLKTKFRNYTTTNASWLNFERIEEPEQNFFKFKQFLADEHLKIAKEKLNSKGIKLCGDCPIGFSEDEIKAFPKAFSDNWYVGDSKWHIRALNYDTILDETSDSAKLFKQKVQLFAKRYDIIRFDVGWAYVTPNIVQGKNSRKISLGSALLEKIEQWVREIKGDNFDVKTNLIYEFEANPKDFAIFQENGQLIEPLKNRIKVYGSTYMHDKNEDAWGYNKAFLDRGWSPDEYVLGVGNHDPQPLKQIAKGITEDVLENINGQDTIKQVCHKNDAIKPLSEILNIPAEKLNNPVEFARAKWAEPMMSKNNMMFYMDVFGREERFDLQAFNNNIHPELNYAYKVPTDYKKAYQQGIQEGFGFNPMDALGKVFRAKGMDKTHPNLYAQIIKFNNLLLEPDEIIEKVPSEKYKCLKPILVCLGIISAGLLAYYSIKKYLKNELKNPDIEQITDKVQKNINLAQNRFYSFEQFLCSVKNNKEIICK